MWKLPVTEISHISHSKGKVRCSAFLHRVDVNYWYAPLWAFASVPTCLVAQESKKYLLQRITLLPY